MTAESEGAIAWWIAKRFVARKDAKAEQTPRGAYNKLDVEWTVDDVVDHLRGTKTYGHYMTNPDTGRTKLCAFDLDVVKEPTIIDGKLCESPRDAIQDRHDPAYFPIMKQLKFMADGLAWKLHHTARKADVPITVAMAFSGSKGVHVYGWFDEPVLTKNSRYMAELTLHDYKCFVGKRGNVFFRHTHAYEAIEIEVFPKQDHVEPGSYGNLMRLPLGQNLKTGGRGYFMKATRHDSNDFLFAPMDPIEALTNGSL